jgi:hypothetical protein
MTVTSTEHRQANAHAVSRNEYTFEVEPSVDRLVAEDDLEPFSPNKIRVMTVEVENHLTLHVSVWGTSTPTGDSWSSRGDARGAIWRSTCCDAPTDKHFKYAPEWVATFVRENTPFGNLLDAAMEQA